MACITCVIALSYTIAIFTGTEIPEKFVLIHEKFSQPPMTVMICELITEIWFGITVKEYPVLFEAITNSFWNITLFCIIANTAKIVFDVKK